MATKFENSEYSREVEDGEIIVAVRQLLEKAGVKGIRGIGPINAERTSIKILLTDDGPGGLPERIETLLSNKRTFGLELQFVRNAKSARLLSGPTPPPWQYSGPLMGGDPIWNDKATAAGTITFAVGMGSPVEVAGYSCANQSITCCHVLDFGGPDDVSTTRYPQSMKLRWVTSPPNGTKWIDLAGAVIQAGVAFSPLEVRGLRHIKGATQPQTGIRVSKYGHKTGLTSGRDLGWAMMELIEGDPNLYGVRVVSGYFATFGDSGAAVLDADRNFLGVVVSGVPDEINETYYVPVVPRGEAPPTSASTGIPDPSFFEIVGL
jgi:hypothetical protein